MMKKEIRYMTIDESIRLVIAIDFGTSRSGFSYAFTGEKKPYVEIGYPNADSPYVKAPTHLLYSPKGNIENPKEDWGWGAKKRLAKLRVENKAKNYDLIENFKMELYEGKDIDPSNGPIWTTNSKRKKFVVDMIADYLKLLKNFAISKIFNTTAGNLREEEILWCLTIPAIWDDSSKVLMRKAAEKAGLVKQYNDEIHLWLVLEPEAAAWYCQEKEAHQLTVGKYFMVIDCGGGTIDITSYKVTANKKLEEVTHGGGPYGSTKIDKLFLGEFLPKILSSSAIDYFHDHEPIDYLEMVAQWERKKCDFDSQTSSDITSFALPIKLYKLLASKFPEVLQKLSDNQDGDDSCIFLTRQTLEGFFEPTLKNIIKVIEEQFQKFGTKRYDYVYLAGGFSESPLLERHIKEHFKGKAQVIRPPKPASAVLEGALLFAFNPEGITRRTRLTYGCDSTKAFQTGLHKESKKKWYEDLKRFQCEDCFSLFVKAGDIVDIDKEVTQIFKPTSRNQKSIKFKLLSTQNRDVLYSDEENVREIGTVEISRSDTSSGLDWQVELTMYFGKTEIQVKAKDVKTGKQVKTQLRFLYTHASELLET